MGKEELLQRKADIEQRFNALVAEQGRIGDEMKRLQGEYRLLEELLSGKKSPPNQTIERPKRLGKAKATDAEN